MSKREELQYGTYRCPVCGHRDGTELRRGESPGRIACSYCSTPLEVTSRGPESVHFSAQVAAEPATR